MHTHQALAEAILARGETLFGLIGDANLYMVDHFRRQGGTYVSAAHEAGAVLMALGYAQTTGQVGIATVTHGPALTNTVTALAEGVRGRIPLVLVAGDTPVERAQHLQDIAQREVVLASGAGFEQVRAPRTAVDDLEAAFRRALVERRPVVLNVPIQFQWSDEVDGFPAPAPTVVHRVAPDPEVVEVATAMLASSRRPLVLAGRGAIDPASRDALVALASRLGAPLATTIKAKGLFRDCLGDVGVLGTMSTPATAELVAQADAVIAFGASLNRFTTGGGSMLAGKAVVQVDSDPAALARLADISLGVIGDSAVVAKAIVALLDEAGTSPTRFVSAVPVGVATLPASPPRHRDDGFVDFVSAIECLEEVVPAERVLVMDGGRFWPECVKRLSVLGPQDFVHTVNFGSIGLGMAEAIGAGVARRDRPVLLVTGDGGFMLGGLSELNSAVRHGVDLVVAVFNDGAYGAEHIQFSRREMDPSLSTFDWPDLAPVATALGATGVTVRSLDDFTEVAKVIADRDRPILIDIRLDPSDIPFDT